MAVTLDGEDLGAEELRRLLAGTDGLAMIRGRWVEVDGDKLRRMLEELGNVERRAREEGITFGEASRMPRARTGRE